MSKVKLIWTSLTLILLLGISVQSNAQSVSGGINFQAIARDSYSNPAKDRKIFVEASIIQSSANGTIALKEKFETTTDATGVFSIVIGRGTRISGTASSLESINWANGPFFLGMKVAIAPIAPVDSWDYTKDLVDLGTTSLGSVPYALYAGNVAGFDTKLNITDTSKMLSSYARVANLNSLVTNKVNVADSTTKYVTPTQLASKTFDSTAIYRTIGTKLNITDSITKYVTPTQLAAKTFDSTAIYNQLALKANTTDVNTSLALKANSTDVTNSLNLKENLSNKSIDVSVDGTSDTKYPSTKAVKTFVESSITNSTVPDATALVKGKIQLTGDLTGTSASPSIATGAVTSSKINDGAVTDAKIATVSGSKVTGNISGNAANITGNIAIVNGGTGATSAAGARTNLGLVIGTDVQAPLSFSAPINKNGNTVSINQATTSVDGYISAADFTSFNNKIDATQKAANNGVATLGNDGKIPSNQIPAISFQSANVVADQNAMLAISGAQVGSIAIRTDNNRNYVLSALPASTLSNWVQLAVPSSVTSVNGSTGPNVVLTTNDVAEGSTNKYYTDARVRGAINASTPLSFNSSTGTISMTAASASSNGYLTSTDFNIFNNKQNAITAGVDYLAPNGSAASLTNFPTLNQNTTGNAATATKLAATKNINGVAFDGSANITVPADGSTLSGSTLASNITASSLTSVGTITSGVWSGTIIAIAKGGTGATTATSALTNLGAEPTANKSTATDLGALNPSDVLFPSQKAVKTYVDLQSSNAGVADGSITNAKLNGGITYDKLAGNIPASKLVGTDITTVGTITSGTWSGSTIAIEKGGTSATTAAGARTNLGLVIGTDVMAANATTTLTGDVTGTGSGTFTTTLSNSGVTAGTYGSSTAIPVVTVDAKGRVTSASEVGIIAGVNTLTYTTGTSYANGGTVSGTTLTLAAADGTNPGLISTASQTIAGAKTFSSNVTAPTFVGNLSGNATTATTAANITATSNTTLTSLANLNTVGTITSGTWSGSVIAIANGGTGSSTVSGAKINLGLNNVENTALSTWAGSNNLTTVGNLMAQGKTFWLQDLILGYGTPNGTKIQTDASNKYISFMPAYGVESTRLWPSGNVTIQHAGTYTDNGYTLEVGGTSKFIGNSIISGDLNVTGNITGATWSGTVISNNKGGAGTVNGLLKANGSGVVSAAVAGTDYQIPLTSTQSNVLSNTSGINTGDQTITLTGDVSGTGTGTFTTTINSVGGVNSSTISGFDTRITANTNSITTNTNDIALRATIASPSFTGTPTAPTPTTGDNSTRIATTEYVQASITAANAGVSSVGPISATANANGATISGSSQLILTPASANFGGVVTTATQTFAGAKTFSNTVTFNSDISVNGFTVGRGKNSEPTNTGFGSYVLFNVTTGSGNGTALTAMGSDALYQNTTGYSNTAIGNGALRSNTTGSLNSGLGWAALNFNTGGGSNTAMGSKSLFSNTTGNFNSALGVFSLYSNTTGSNNTGVGNYSLYSNTTGGNNTGIGNNALNYLSSGSDNIAVGLDAGKLTGSGAGVNLTNSNKGIYIGSGTRAGTNTTTNEVVIGYNALGNGSNTVTIGNLSNTATYFTGDINLTGNVSGGTWSGTIIGSNYGGAGTVNGLLKANGSGVVSAAVAGTDYQAPLTSTQSNVLSNTSGINTGDQTITLTGDVTGTGTGTFTTTLSNSGVSANTYGSSTAIPVLTVDVKGRVTSASTVGIIAGVNTLTYTTGATYANGGTVSGTTLTLAAADGSNPGLISTGAQTIAGAKTFSNTVTAPTFIGALSGNATTATTAGNITATSNTTLTSLANLATVGTITSGTWSGSVIGSNVGGAGTVNGLLKANGSGVVSAAVAGTDYQVPLTASSGISISSGTISVTGLTSSNLSSTAGITNAQLANSSTTLGSTTMTLGGTVTSVTGLTSLNTTNLTATNITGTLSGTATGLATGRTISTTGDVTYTSGAFDGTANVTGVATLAASGVASGTYGSSTSIPVLTVDTKGRVTSANSVSITAGVNTMTAIAGTSNANGATISGTALTLTPADASNGGIVTNGTQTFGGTKTFSSTNTANSNLAQGSIFTPTLNTSAAYDMLIGVDINPTFSGANLSTSSKVGLRVKGASIISTGVGNDNTNLALGQDALGKTTKTSGGSNVAVGNSALYNNLTSTWNTAVGNNALFNLQSGGNNTALGLESLSALTSSSNNTAVGLRALKSTTGSTNTSLGSYSLSNYQNDQNIGIGFQAGAFFGGSSSNNYTGSASTTNNIFIGNSSGPLNNTDNNEIVIASGTTVGMGSGTTTIGYTNNVTSKIYGDTLRNNDYNSTYQSGSSFFIKSQNAQIGTNFNGGNITLIPGAGGGLSGSNNGKVVLNSVINVNAGTATVTTDGMSSFITAQNAGTGGNNNGGNITLTPGTATGTGTAGRVIASTDMTINGITAGRGLGNLSSNTAFGSAALSSNTTGYNNTAIGVNALNANVTTWQNTAVGFEALKVNTASNNTAVGTSVLAGNISGTLNSALGNLSMLQNTSGNNNSAFGAMALRNNFTGSDNIAFGQSAGTNLSGSQNVYLGSNVGLNTTSVSNNILIGYGAGQYYGTASNTNYTTGGGNVLIGNDVRPQADGQTNQIVISGYTGSGVGMTGNGSNTVTIGNSANTANYFRGTANINTGTLTSTQAVNVVGSVNDFLEFNIQNNSNGTGAQSGINAMANNGTDAVNFAWMGINSSTFNNPQTYNIGIANDVSFLGGGNDMYVANSSNKASIIFSTGTASSPYFNERMRITNSGTVAIGTTGATSVDTTNAKLHIAGKVKIVDGNQVAGKVLTTDATGLATWQNTGGTVVTMSATGTATATASYIIFTGSTASSTITIPSAVTMGSGREITIKNVASVSVSIASAGGYLIMDNSTLTNTSVSLGIEPSNNWLKLVSDGTNWYIFRALF